jgi:hypothetical protein
LSGSIEAGDIFISQNSVAFNNFFETGEGAGMMSRCGEKIRVISPG